MENMYAEYGRLVFEMKVMQARLSEVERKLISENGKMVAVLQEGMGGEKKEIK
jgi:hypothetical protein